MLQDGEQQEDPPHKHKQGISSLPLVETIERRNTLGVIYSDPQQTPGKATNSVISKQPTKKVVKTEERTTWNQTKECWSCLAGGCPDFVACLFSSCTSLIDPTVI